jgi:hypothetical protein
MVIHTTRWSPDTCQCILEYEWDDSVPENQRTHTPATVVKKCTGHQPLPDINSVFNTLLDENPRKNKALAEILANAPSNSWYDIDATSGSRVFKQNITVKWTWTGTAPNRVLTLSFTGITLTNAQKNTLQTRLNTLLGSGKVTIG